MPAKSPLDVADGALGQLVERLTISHHRRRLARVRWTAAIDPPPGGWAAGEPPPRPGNAVTVLVDGAEAFRAMVDAIENARSHVHVTGWHLTPDFALTRDEAPRIVRRLLAEVATRIPVRVLIWAGAPLPVLRPWRGDVRAIREQLVSGTGTQCALDARERPMHCHHEKTIVVDDQVAFVGGVELQLVRTVPDGMYQQLPRGEFRILESYLRGLRAAQRLVYLENQYLWSPEILALLREKLARPPTPEFRLVLLLPAKPDNGADDTRGQLGTLVQADGEGGRLLACTLSTIGGEKDWPVYIHAKVGIVDDAWMTIGSANLNEHSLFNDTEMNLVTRDARLARETRVRLWAEHLQRPVDEVAGDPVAVIDRLWKPIAHEQAQRRKRGERATHRLSMLPGISRRSRLLLGPLQGLDVDA